MSFQFDKSPNDIESICCNFDTDSQKENLQRFLDYDTKVLDLTDCRFHDVGSKILAGKIETSTELKELILNYCDLKEDEVNCILVACEINASIEVIDLCCNEVDDELASKLGILIKNNNRFKVISLDSCNIGDVGITGISDGLAHNNSVKKIDVSGNRAIGYDGIKAFGMMLKVNTGLKEISFVLCYLTDKEVEVLVTSLEHNSTVETIDLSGNPFGMKTAEAFRRMIQINYSLKKIILSGCELRSAVMKIIVDGLTKNTNNSIDYIDLSCNMIDGDCAKEIRILLSSSSSLKTFHLKSCYLSSTKIKIILEGMVENVDSSIEHISLNNNNNNSIDCDCATLIGVLLQRINCSIKVLGLRHTMKPRGMKIIAKKLEQNASVEEVDLSCDWNGGDDEEYDVDDGSDDENDSGEDEDNNTNETVIFNILFKRRSNSSSDSIIAETSLLYHLVREKPVLFNNVYYVDDSNTDEKGGVRKEPKRRRLD